MASEQEPEMRSEIYVYYALKDVALDPNQVTQATGIVPSETWRVGDSLLPKLPKIRAKVSGWQVSSDMPLTSDIDEQVRSVLQRLQPGWPALCQLGTQYNAVIECVVKSFGGDRPAICFDPNIVRLVGELNAYIDVDLYIFD